MTPVYCGHCGLPLTDGTHSVCARRLELEPPRYCAQCRRRMVVQVTPDHWTARCSEHGETTSSTWEAAPPHPDSSAAALRENPDIPQTNRVR